MVLLELTKSLLLVRDLGGKGVLESGDGADGSSSPLGGEERLINDEEMEGNMRERSKMLAHDVLEMESAS